jgi:hypothetical protein
MGPAPLVGCADSPPTASAPDLDALPTLSYQEDLRVGSREDPELGFSQVGGVQVAPDGNVYVLDRQEREVRVYDQSGTPVRVIGRPGQGPGEFERPIQIGLLHDTLWVRDVANDRISWFDADGRLLFETRLAERVSVDIGVPASILITPGAPRADGYLGGVIGFGMVPGAPPLPDSFLVPVVRFDRTGAVADTVGWRVERGPLNSIVSLDRVSFSVSTGIQRPPVEIDDSVAVSWEVAPSNDRGSLTVVRAHSRADTVYRRELRYTPAPLPVSYADSIVEVYGDRFFERGLNRGTVETAVRAVLAFLPAHYPPISTVRVGSDGTIWLRRSDAGSAAAAKGLATWILIDPDGEVRGSLDLPGSMTVLWSDDRVAWGVDRDVVEVPWLVRIGIRP